MKDSKPFYMSKTLWVNIILGITAIAVPKIHGMLVANPEYFSTGFTVINIILRIISKDKIEIA